MILSAVKAFDLHEEVFSNVLQALYLRPQALSSSSGGLIGEFLKKIRYLVLNLRELAARWTMSKEGRPMGGV